VPKLYATPAPGLNVRSPDHGGQFLPAEGAEVESSAYWTRRKRDGDVTLGPIPAAPTARIDAANDAPAAKPAKKDA
jgi:hypothetical protein